MNKRKRNIHALLTAIEDALRMKKDLDADISRIGTVIEKIINRKLTEARTEEHGVYRESKKQFYTSADVVQEKD